MRSLSRTFEWVVVWSATIVAAIFAVILLLSHDLHGLIYLGGAYFLSLLLLIPLFRFSVSSKNRRRDKFPWDRSIIQITGHIPDIKNLIPELSLTKTDCCNRLWTAEYIGKNGTWSIGLEDRDDTVVGYYIYYKHRCSTAYDYGVSRASINSYLIPV